PSSVAAAGEESAAMDRLVADRERIGPVNLVAAEELARIEDEHGASAREQAELVEAVNRLRGSIGNLNREGRERLRLRSSKWTVISGACSRGCSKGARLTWHSWMPTIRWKPGWKSMLSRQGSGCSR